LFIYKY